ncbi:MAG: hypothetical protein AAF570_01835, partial [Bacteroidota bacterium]
APVLFARIRFRQALDPNEIDFLVATGSDNTARYIAHDFNQVPHVLRGNRYSIACLSGQEAPEQLAGLAQDILLYHGMGCRSVSNLLVPRGYDLTALVTALEAFPEAAFAPDWWKILRWENALAEMEGLRCLPCTRVVLRKAMAPSAAGIGVVNVVEYADEVEMAAHLDADRAHLQCVVGQAVPFGQAQCPKIDDFADGIDLLKAFAALEDQEKS